MGNKIESYCCMIQNTKYMTNLLFHSDDIEKYKKEIDILFNWERFKSVEEIKNIDNFHIQKAIEELEEKYK